MSHMNKQSNDQQQVQQQSGESFSEYRQRNITKMESKISRLTEKKINKFKQQIQNAISYIGSQKILQAIQIIKNVLIKGQNFDLYPFKGQGFKQDWEEYLPDGPMEFFLTNKETGNLSKNPFDLLSLYYSILISKDKKISTNQYFDFYNKLQQKQGEQCYQIHIGKGHLYYAKNQYYEAQKNYQKARIVNKSHQKLFECLAWIKITKFKDYAKGQVHLQKCLQINPDNFGALFLKAIKQKNNKNKSIQKLIEINPKYYRLYIQRGLLETQSKNIQKWFQIALKYNHNSILVNLALIKQQLKNNKFSKMGKKLSETQFLQKQQPNVLFFLAQTQNTLNPRKAIESYQKCLEIDPYHFQALQGLAEVYRLNSYIDQLGQQKAISLYKRYIECNPYNCDIYNYLGLALEEADQRQQALNNYKKALQINPQFFQAQLNLGQLYQQEENYELALTSFLRADQIRGQDGNACYGIAIFYYFLDNYKQSQLWAQQCCDNGCDDSNQVYQLLGDISFCKLRYLQSLKWYLRYVGAIEQIRTQYIMQNLIKKISLKQAIQILKEAFQVVSLIAQNQMYLFLQLGILIQLLGQYEYAFSVYKTLKRMIHRNKQKPDEIKKQLQRVFEDNRLTGALSLKSKVIIRKLRQNYFTIFTQTYNSQEIISKQRKI